MAVTTSQASGLDPFPSQDPRYPLGRWIARGSVSGDVSGGLASIIFPWSTAQTDLIFSVEAVSVYNNHTVLIPALVQLQTRQRSPDGSDITVYDSIQAAGLVSTTEQAIFRAYQGAAWIFNPDNRSSAWQLEFYWANNNNVTYVATAWGYVWASGVLKSPRGPLRPGDSP